MKNMVELVKRLAIMLAAIAVSFQAKNIIFILLGLESIVYLPFQIQMDWVQVVVPLSILGFLVINKNSLLSLEIPQFKPTRFVTLFMIAQALFITYYINNALINRLQVYSGFWFYILTFVSISLIAMYGIILFIAFFSTGFLAKVVRTYIGQVAIMIVLISVLTFALGWLQIVWR
jgi:hypothetical protein